MVETGSAGASSNTPASSFDFGQGIFLTRTGVHRIRTITPVYRSKCTGTIGVAQASQAAEKVSPDDRSLRSRLGKRSISRSAHSEPRP